MTKLNLVQTIKFVYKKGEKAGLTNKETNE